MDDERFDGKRVYWFGSARRAIYDIRGQHLHKANGTTGPQFEICSNHIYALPSGRKPTFYICGNFLRTVRCSRQALYEIR